MRVVVVVVLRGCRRRRDLGRKEGSVGHRRQGVVGRMERMRVVVAELCVVAVEVEVKVRRRDLGRKEGLARHRGQEARARRMVMERLLFHLRLHPW